MRSVTKIGKQIKTLRENSRSVSIGVFIVDENCLDGQPDDSDVEPDGPVFHIPDVTLHATLHLPEFLCLTAITRHLRPTRHARLHEVSHHIRVYQLRIHLRMCQHVWSRAHDTHIPLQHIPELRQFINVCLTHKITKGIFPWVVLRCLHLVCILVYMHRTELQTVEILTIQSRSQLFEEDSVTL